VEELLAYAGLTTSPTAGLAGSRGGPCLGFGDARTGSAGSTDPAAARVPAAWTAGGVRHRARAIRPVRLHCEREPRSWWRRPHQSLPPRVRAQRTSFRTSSLEACSSRRLFSGLSFSRSSCRSDPLRPGVALRLSGRIGARGASPGECFRQRPACGAERGSTRPGVSNIRPSRSARGPIRPNPAERLSSRTLARRDTTTGQPRAVWEQGRSRSVAGLRASNSSPTARRRRLAGGSRRGVRKRTGAPAVDVTWPLRLVSRSPPPGRMAARWLR
jgi:hypothetical protein